MVNYKDLGLVNTREMFKKAVSGGYAIPAFNFNTMEQMQAIVQAAVETKSPVIMQVSKGARNYANATILRYMAEGAVAYAKELGCEKPESIQLLQVSNESPWSRCRAISGCLQPSSLAYSTAPCAIYCKRVWLA